MSFSLAGPSTGRELSTPSTNQFASASDSTVVATCNIPDYEETFRYVQDYLQVESLLSKISNPKLSPQEVIFHGEELLHLLKVVTNNNSSTESAGRNTNENTRESIGCRLCHPQPLKHQAGPNETFRQKLQSSPYVSFGSSSDDLSGSATTTSSKPIEVPLSMLQSIFKISSELRIPEIEAASLYGAVATTFQGSDRISQGGIISSVGMSQSSFSDLDLDRTTLRYFQKMNRPSSADASLFCERAVAKAKQNGTYISSRESNTIRNIHGEKISLNGRTIQDLAKELYLWERSYSLKTILTLIQHRVSCCSGTACVSSSDINSTTNVAEAYFPNPNMSRSLLVRTILLQATDQLIQHNLIGNLIQLIRDMTTKNEQLEKKICTVLKQEQQQDRDHTGFRTGSGAAPGTSSLPTEQDMDYVFYELTLQQRDLACKCLFYLTYQTQCTSEEVVGIIDLIRDLTNGAKSNGIGSGLPILDPLADITDPFILAWKDGNELGGFSSSMTGFSQSTFRFPNNNIMTPEEIKTFKDPVQWEQELISSLWSVKGLTDATVTTSQIDVSGVEMFKTFSWESAALSSSISTSTVGTSMGNGGNLIIGGGKPQLLQCVMKLVLSAICSMDGRQVLMERNVHGPNYFGVGNALLPSPEEESVLSDYDKIKNISAQLVPSKEGFPTWKRQDIVGLLSATFSLLLRPAVAVLASSPRPSHRARNFSIDSLTEEGTSIGTSTANTVTNSIKAMFRSCLEVPMMTKSITFARLSLLPCIGTSSTASNTSTIANLDKEFLFYISVLSDFTSQYLDTICSFSDLPISREKWMNDEIQELKLRHVQETQRRELHALSGQMQQDRSIPSEVDITKRPDCLDDIIALTVSICSTCPDCARNFWSVVATTSSTIFDSDSTESKIREKSECKLKPSRILKKLEQLQAEDRSLLPSYLSFLGVLNLAGAPDEDAIENGATAVHSWLSSNKTNSSDTVEKVDWKYVLDALRWYANDLTPATDKKNTNTSKIGLSRPTAEESTAYYYGADTIELSTSNPDQMNSSNNTSLSDSGNKLNEENAVMIMSLLNLVSNASLCSDEVKKNILDTKITNKDKFGPDDDVLTILFSLLVTPITPDVRGLILVTLANLVRFDHIQKLPREHQESVIDIARRSWECLDICQIIPFTKLSQFPSQQNMDVSENLLSTFYPSNAIKYLANNSTDNWFPPSGIYGILYEIEYVESKSGRYPLTEGLLTFLHALISTVGCPSDLGKKWRPRPGCTPYIEFVINFLIPRIVGKGGRGKPLYFASTTDKLRLLTRAMEVIEAVLTVYAKNPAENMTLFHNALADSVDSSDAIKSARVQDTIPDVKGPGFCILADALSPSGTLFGILTHILLDKDGTIASCSDEMTSRRIAFSLYVDTPPAFSAACAGRDFILEHQKQGVSNLKAASLPMESIKSLLEPLYPKAIHSTRAASSNFNASQSLISENDSGVWKETCLLLALRILSSVAVHERNFLGKLSHTITMIPVLRFKPRDNGVVVALEKKSIQVAELATYLYGSSSSLTKSSTGIIPVITQLIGYTAKYLDNEEEIATLAMKLISHLLTSAPVKDYTQALNNDSEANVSMSLANRLSSGLKVNLTSQEITIHEDILNLLIHNLKLDTLGNDNFSHIVLGLSGQTLESRMEQSNDSNQVALEYGIHHNVLDAILELLSDMGFVLGYNTSSLATKCYEIIYRLCEPRRELESYLSWDIRVCVMAKLRKINFWNTHLLRFLGRTEPTESILHLIINESPLCDVTRRNGEKSELTITRDTNFLHSMSWLLKAISIELQALVGNYQQRGQQRNDLSQGALAFLSPKPSRSRDLLVVLLGSEKYSILEDSIKQLPIHKLSISNELAFNAPSQNLTISISKPLEGAIEVCKYYQQIDFNKLELLIQSSENSGASGRKENARQGDILEWSKKWNSYVKFDCSVSHFASAWSTLLQNALVLCPPELELNENMKYQQFLDKRGLLHLLKLLLERLNLSSHQGELQPRCCLPLSVSCLSLLEFLFRPTTCLQDLSTDSQGIFLDQDELIQLVFQTTGAITTCYSNSKPIGNSHDDRAVALNCSLIVIVDYFIRIGGQTSPSISPQIYLQALKCAKYLLSLSSYAIYDDHPPQVLQNATMIRSARSGLSSLIIWFEMNQNKNTESNRHGANFLQELFSEEQNKVLLSNLIKLIVDFDSDITFLFEKIASCMHGTTMLVEGGITKALCDSAGKMLKETKSALEDHMGSEGFGNNEMEPSSFVFHHLNLFNIMLSSQSLAHTQRILLFDTVKYVRMNDKLFVYLLRNYPKYGDITTKLITSIYLITSRSDRGVDGINTSSPFEEMKRCIMQLAFHLGQFPLPDLPPLPNRLLRYSQKLDENWWFSIKNGFAISNGDIGEGWSNEMFRYALDGAHILELSLMVLIAECRIGSTSNHLKIDGISIAKAIYQMSTAAQLIESKLRGTETISDINSNSMLGLNSIEKNMSSSTRQSFDFNRLKELGFKFGRCAEKILTLALYQAKTFTKSHASPILLALSDTKIESDGIACVANDIGSLTARQLRFELENLV